MSKFDCAVAVPESRSACLQRCPASRGSHGLTPMAMLAGGCFRRLIFDGWQLRSQQTTGFSFTSAGARIEYAS